MSKKKDIRRQNILQLILGLVIIVLVNVIGYYYFTRFDLTSEKKYTLSPATKELVKSFDDYVTFKVYLDGDFPAGFKKLQRETREMLDEFNAYNSNIQYEFIDPNEITDERDRQSFYAELNQKGLEPTSIRQQDEGRQSQQIIFPGAVVTYKANRETAVNLLESQMGASSERQINNSTQALEYNLASALKKLSSAKKDKIAFLHGHGELSKLSLEGATRALSEFYDVTHLILENKVYGLLERFEKDTGNVVIKPRFDALIVARPTKAISDQEKFLIDQYIMYGGKVLWFVDPVATNMDSLQESPRTLAMPAQLNLDGMLFRYGVRLNRNLIQDQRSAQIPVNTQPVGAQPKFEMFPWPYFPVLMPATNHQVVKNLNGVKGEFVSTLDTISSNKLKKTILLQSSENSRVLSMPHEVSLSLINRRANPKQYDNGPQNVAVLLEGKFRSNYENRLPPEIASDRGLGFRTESDSSAMIVVADGDIIRSSITSSGGNTRALPLGVDKFTGQQYGNEDFVLNCVNYLCDESGLLNVKGRDLKIRMLNRPRVMEEKTKWQIINVVLPILLIMLFSVSWNVIRRKKYRKK